MPAWNRLQAGWKSIYKDDIEKSCFPFRRSLSAGTASAASLALLAPGSSARAVPAGVERLHSKQLCFLVMKNFYAQSRDQSSRSSKYQKQVENFLHLFFYAYGIALWMVIFL
ncbi:hypothetical protein EEX84_09915 [Planococcus salinus]|uniref:Uncharacterized protein n=1 Tax=Planococcus salinus TaxID=1848460 RepID=A0A3M8P7I6_9BACL|nr:hypothetical protein EEX84_09915 [Planococcus salinus]